MPSNELTLSPEELAQQLLRLSTAEYGSSQESPQEQISQLRSAIAELAARINTTNVPSDEAETPAESIGDQPAPSNQGVDQKPFTLRPKKPRTYSGEDKNGACEKWCLEVYDYIAQCRAFFRPELTNQQEVFLASEHLSGPAKAWWASYMQQISQGLITRKLPASFNEFSEVLRTNYGDFYDQIQRRESYEALQQTTSVRDFANSLNDHRLFLVPQPSEFEVLRRFRTGLSFEIRIEMDKHYAQITDLQEYVEKADNYDRALCRERLLRQKDKNKTPYTGTIHSVKERSNDRTKLPYKSKQWCRANGACFNCKKVGHRVQECL